MFAHSATSNSGAINLAFWRSANASGVTSSSTTHLTAMLASMTSVFTATKENFRGRLFPPFCQLPQVGS